MSYLARSVTEKKYPVRYWSMVVSATSLPNFVKFDNTGLTHTTSAFNISTVLGLLLAIVPIFLLGAMAVMNRQRLMLNKIDYCKWLWLALAVNLTISTLLMGPNKLMPGKHLQDIVISLYRIFGWVLGMTLIVSVYSREPKQTATDMIVRIVGICCWFNILIVWLILPVAPSLAYNADADSPESAARLGGILISPIGLGVYAGIGFFYALLFLRGRLRVGGCCLAFLTLVLTYARTQQLSFILLLAGYLLVISRRPIYRWGATLLLLLGLAAGTVFSGEIINYEGRGNGVHNILTLSERTYVWDACFKAFWLKPYLGYGVGKGVANAIRDQWTFTHWIPPEAHNEFIQALVSGGVLACALVLYLYGQTIWKGFRIYRNGPKEVFLLLVFLQVTFMSIGESIITVGYGRASSLFILSFFGINASYPRVRAALVARSQKKAPAAEIRRSLVRV